MATMIQTHWRMKVAEAMLKKVKLGSASKFKMRLANDRRAIILLEN